MLERPGISWSWQKIKSTCLLRSKQKALLAGKPLFAGTSRETCFQLSPLIKSDHQIKFEPLWLGAAAFVFADDQDQNHTKTPGDHSGRVGISTLNWDWKPSEMTKTGIRCPSTVGSSRQTQLTLRDSENASTCPACSPMVGKAGAQTLPYLLALARAHHHPPSVTMRRPRQPVPSLSSRWSPSALRRPLSVPFPTTHLPPPPESLTCAQWTQDPAETALSPLASLAVPLFVLF